VHANTPAHGHDEKECSMHYLTHVAPLLIRSLTAPVMYALLPVPMRAFPTQHPDLLSVFLKPRGQMLSLHEDDAHRVRKYMARHHTEALTSDGQAAFTLHGNQLLQCDPTVAGQPPQRLFVQFLPQTWTESGRASCGAAEDVDVTDEVLRQPADVLADMRDGSEAAASLVDPESRGHLGPYSVLCEAQFCAFFGVNSVSDITGDALEAKRAGALTLPGHVPLDLTGGSVWMIGVGVEKIHYTCRADTIDDAIGKCREAFPGRPVASAYAVA